MARTPIHPGEILADELDEIGLSAKRLADVIEVPPNRLYQLLAGKRSVTADTALRLSQYFGMAADFWMNLQSAYELDLARQQNGKAIQRIPKRRETAEPRPPLSSRLKMMAVFETKGNKSVSLRGGAGRMRKQ
jgi:antitoxin HigA-1